MKNNKIEKEKDANKLLDKLNEKTTMPCIVNVQHIPHELLLTFGVVVYA